MIEKQTTGSFFTNSYIISNSSNEAIIVDLGLSYLNTANYIKSKYDVKAILLTHAHLDHIDGLKYFLDLPIYLYKDELDVFLDDYKSLYKQFLNIENPYKDKRLNFHLLNDLEEFDLIGYHFKVFHTKGHTKGSVIYQMNDNLFTGDTLFNMSVGRVDFPTGSEEDILKSIDFILNNFKDNYICYPGHGENTTIGFEKKYNPYFKR